MNLLNIKTEYSYRVAFGHVPRVIDRLKTLGVSCAGICDRNGTWGHVVWEKQCKKAGIKPIFGVELAVVDDARLREKQAPCFMSFIAKNNSGLKEIYELVTTSTDNFYYIARIDYSDLEKISENVFVFIGANPDWNKIKNITAPIYLDLKPTTPKATKQKALEEKIELVAMIDNCFVYPDDRGAYEVAMNRWKERRTIPMHIMNQGEWIHHCGNDQEAIERANKICEEIKVNLPTAQMVKFDPEKTLKELCQERAPEKNVDLSDPVYKERFEKELKLIEEKKFEDYFYVIWDLLKFAKKHMLVGPARGSSCGSLVCYLLDITEIDPIPHGLIFERFIDINRSDMPDIDIDFPDSKRDKVFDYLKEKYGELNVARLGSVNKFMPKKAMADTAKQLDIPPWEIKDLKEIIVDKKQDALKETFETMDLGKKISERYPHLRVCEQLEGHASHAGQHAAGIVVTAHPVSKYCSIDIQTGAVQIDKRDAETLDLLKIDALGLRTLSIIEDCLEQIGWSNEKLLNYPIDDQKAYAVINDKKFSSIFQFDGRALQSICAKMKIENFNDITAITSLARPGPLDSGGTEMYISRKNQEEKFEYDHESLEPILGETYGVIVYQEQVMRIVREIGHLSWGDTSAVRKAVSKSSGAEYLSQFKLQFVDGAMNKSGIDGKIAEGIFENIITFGSYGFNKSHAVAYGLVSYWCMVLKGYFPLEWAVASLRNSGSGEAGEDRCIKLLRELDKEGIKYKNYDAELSKPDWSFSNGTVLGGLTNVKGIGKKVAADIIRRRKSGEELTKRQKNLLADGKTPFDLLYEGKELFGHVLSDPSAFNVTSRIWRLDEIQEDYEGEFLVMAKMLSKTLRDANELVNIEKRKARAEERGEDIGDGIIHGQTLYLNCKIEDDSGQIFYARIDRQDYKKMGVPLVEKYNDNDWFLWKGGKIKGINMLFISRIKFIGNKKVGCVI